MSSLMPRITARVDAETQSLLSNAAAASGISSINSFVLNAAIEKAKTIMASENTIQLSQRDALTLIASLDSSLDRSSSQSSKTNDRLKQAAENYSSKIQS